MRTHKILLFLILGIFLINFYIYSIIFYDNENLVVYFLDIGQGDSTLIRSPSGRIILIDGGDGSIIMNKLSQVLPFGVRDIDLVIATHPDKDHINGLIPVFDKFNVPNFLYSNIEKDSDIYKSLLDKVRKEGSTIFIAKRGQVFDLGGGAYLEILFPDRLVSEVESNTGSIVSRIVYRDNEFLITGDSPQSIEKYLVYLDGDTLSSDVLKLGHHGSKTSSSKIFLEKVRPSFGVLSYGKDNKYGHPNKEPLDFMADLSINPVSTAGGGSIVFYADGSNLIFEQK